MTYTADQLRSALLREYQSYTHDSYDTDVMNDAQYRSYLQSLTFEQLIAETDTDDTVTLDEFISTYS